MSGDNGHVKKRLSGTILGRFFDETGLLSDKAK